jgi:HK97 family phage major capsid protein
MSTATETRDLEGEIKATQGRLDALLKKTDAAGNPDWTDQERDEFKAIDKELTDKVPKLNQLREDREAHRRALQRGEEIKALGAGGGGFRHGNPTAPNLGGDGASALSQAEYKSLGQLITEDDEYKSARERRQFNKNGKQHFSFPDVDVFELDAMKTAFTTAAGWAPPNNRGPVVIYSAQRRPMIADLIPSDPVGPGANSVVYMEETTFTNNAAATAQNATKPESAFVLTQRTVIIEKIAVTLPITDEQLEDVPQARAYVDNRLTLQMQLVEENLLLSGTGTSPQITGFLVKTGVQTRTGTASTVLDAILLGITDVQTIGFANPTGIVMNPVNWTNLMLLKDTTGRFIFSPPGEVKTPTIWGLDVVPTMAMTLGSALLGDFRMYSHISRRKGLTIDVGYSGTDWVNNRQTIRAEQRESLEIYRPAAFEVISGL